MFKKNVKLPENIELASQIKRILNLVIDVIFIFIIYLICMFILVFEIKQNDNFNLESISYIFRIKFLILTVFPIIYFLIFEFYFQKTIAKFITKTKVINLQNEKPSFKEILIRTFCRLIPFDYLSYLFSKQGVHDKFSNTIVIND